MSGQVLVLWDIDRTLLYVGDIDRQVYRETYHELTGRTAGSLPKRGTGTTMPLAILRMLVENGIAEDEAASLLPTMVELLPQVQRRHIDDIRRDGVLLPGAVAALRAVHDEPEFLPTIVTGNLKANALLKLAAFDLSRHVHTDIGGYASDDMHRPSLVGIAQKRAEALTGQSFGRSETVIIGDSLEDIRTGREGGASVIASVSGTTSADELAAAGADLVLEDLTDQRRVVDSIRGLAG
ncbi:haloacid dehalogenase-like hydrolase [Streptomyces sp. NBC_01520]|uniref:haloacid dehalogenase-like hydrolase n=1 Tax=Streptomyces sp. NBC_01520 TaxID=2903892 RepID=UPI00386AB171